MALKPETQSAEEEAEEGDGAILSLSELVAQGDVDGLIALAKAHRTGTGGVERDLKKCFEAYVAASRIGSPLADYSLALFYWNGGIVEKDVKEAASRMRAAADAGYTPAKIGLANLYEMGIHYKADPSKADVWYRNAARSAGVKGEPGSGEYRRGLAELGAVRACLEIAKDPASSDDDKAIFLKRARAQGYREGERFSSPSVEMTPLPGGAVPSQIPSQIPSQVPSQLPSQTAPQAQRAVSEPPAPPPAAAKAASQTDVAPTAKVEAKKEAEKPKEEKAPKAPLLERLNVDFGDGMTAFFLACVLMSMAFAGSYALNLAAEHLRATGQPIPIVGPHTERILPILLGALGVLPSLLVYRLPTWLRAVVVGAAAGWGGALAWGAHYVFIEPHLTQILVFGASGFLAALLVLGIFGGTRSGYKARHLKKISVGAPLRLRGNLKP